MEIPNESKLEKKYTNCLTSYIFSIINKTHSPLNCDVYLCSDDLVYHNLYYIFYN